MDDMMSVIQSAMQNPETMAQLNAIAQSLFQEITRHSRILPCPTAYHPHKLRIRVILIFKS